MKIIKLLVYIDDYLLVKKSNQKAFYEFPYLESENLNLEEELKEKFLGSILTKWEDSPFSLPEARVVEVYLENYKLEKGDKLLYLDELFTLEYQGIDLELVKLL